MKEMREKLESHELEEEFTASIQKPIDLLDMQMKRLTLKKKPFKTFSRLQEVVILMECGSIV